MMNGRGKVVLGILLMLHTGCTNDGSNRFNGSSNRSDAATPSIPPEATQEVSNTQLTLEYFKESHLLQRVSDDSFYEFLEKVGLSDASLEDVRQYARDIGLGANETVYVEFLYGITYGDPLPPP